jgi:hypothetical protein
MRRFLPLLFAPEFLSLPGDRASRFGWERAREAFVGDWNDARVGVVGCDFDPSGSERRCLLGDGGSAIAFDLYWRLYLFLRADDTVV